MPGLGLHTYTGTEIEQNQGFSVFSVYFGMWVGWVNGSVKVG